MAKLAALRHAFGRTAINEVAPPAAVNDGRSTAPMQEMPTKSEADITVNRADESGDASSTLGKELQSQEDMQRGVKDVEAITQTWSKPSLIAAFLLLVSGRLKMCHSMLIEYSQLLVAILRQCFPIFHSQQPDSVCY
jgi:hypothetical protein